MSDKMRPFFFQGVAGKLFCLHFPADRKQCKGAVLHVPAFAEEMNKSRHMVVKQARDLARNGYSVLIVDLYGTGDSEGEFSEASWDIWEADVLCLADWLKQNHSQHITLWGLRLGGLLAVACAQKSEFVQHLLLWQPVVSGEQFMQQFLRLRLAASMMGDGSKETIKSLKTAMERGESLEVAGYSLPPTLFSSVTAIKMNGLDVSSIQSVKWLEVNSTIKPLSIPSQKLVSHWQSEPALSIRVETVEGKQFWSNQEVVWADNLIQRTSHLFTEQTVR